MYISTSDSKGIHVTTSAMCCVLQMATARLGAGWRVLHGAVWCMRQPATRVRFVILDDFIEYKHCFTEEINISCSL